MCNHQGTVSLLSTSLIISAAGMTTLQNIVTAVSGKRQTRLLQCPHKESAVKYTISPSVTRRLKTTPANTFHEQKKDAPAGTKWSDSAPSSRLSLRSTSLHGPTRLPYRECNVSRLLPKCFLRSGFPDNRLQANVLNIKC